jgi:hypothetical protein
LEDLEAGQEEREEVELTKLSAGLKDWLGRERKELSGEFVSACHIGKFGREKHFDRALPQWHTKQLYGSLSYDGTKILVPASHR